MNIKNIVPEDLHDVPNVDPLVQKYVETFKPLEANERFSRLGGCANYARYCECHIRSNKLVVLFTTTCSMIQRTQPEYRVEIVTSHMSFERMQRHAKQRRSLSTIDL